MAQKQETRMMNSSDFTLLYFNFRPTERQLIL